MSVELLQSIHGTWLLDIDAKNWSLGVAIPRTAVVSIFAAFLRRTIGTTLHSEIDIGTLFGSTVKVHKDDEFPDRYFIRVVDKPYGGILELLLIDPEATDLRTAMDELVVAVAETQPNWHIEPDDGNT
jgi:hypothetical protein